MKNLFKKLMLVAVAAMAFTACQNDNNEVNEVAKKTVISGVLSFDEETRSGFAGKNEAGDAYVSEWDGGETIKIYIDGYGSVFTNVDAEGRFEVAVDGEISSGTSMYVCSPADAWDSQWTPTIPTEQTPRANSVDPAAHILQSMGATVASSMITMSPQQACYGKMTVNAPDFEIAKVEVSFNDGQVYTLNATNVENNVFWFAVDSMIDVATFTVTAYDAENNAITKTVDVAAAGKTLKFQWGHVSTFSVSGLEAPVQPEEPAAPAFTSAEVAYDDGAEKYITFNCNNGALQSLTIDIANAFAENNTMLREGTYTHDTLTQDGKIYARYSDYGDYHLYTISMTVTYVPEGYYIVFEDVREYYDEYILFERATYTGAISGLVTPSVGGGDEPENPGVGGGDEPEETYDSTYAYIYEGGIEYNDVSYMFVADDNSGLRIDFCGIIENNSIPTGTYTFSTSYGMYPSWSFYYPDVDGWDSTKLKYGQAVVSVEDGQYKIVFTNLADGAANVVVEKFTFKGELPGLNIP